MKKLFLLITLSIAAVLSAPTVQAVNPYLPLWEHLPDGEPRVFEDPDQPGKYRVYIIGSHDVRFDSYCGPDIRVWSAPVEDLSDWRDEGAVFTFQDPQNGRWDVMYAPDMIEVLRRDETGARTLKEYYLYPHSRGPGREAMVAKGTRPEGPFTPINLAADGRRLLPGSIVGFDPALYVEYVDDPNDPDYAVGFRVYAYWGFQQAFAAELDQNTMWSLRPGRQIIRYFIPSSARFGVLRDPPGTEYPHVFPDEDLTSFNYFEAFAVRKVGNKYVLTFSGYSGPDYGLGSTNSALRYAFGDSPLGPWRSGGVLVDSRAPVLNQNGNALQTSSTGHNTHGGLQLINNQWYVFYHRPPRGFGNARQPMVAPVKIDWDEKSVAEGGRVTIRAYHPYAEDGIWTVKDSQGREYTGAEVTSEGFHFYGLDPYKYYSAGYACYLSNPETQQDSWDIWDNHMPITNVANGHRIGYKYFGFGGLAEAKKGLNPFEGTKPGNNTKFNVWLTPRTRGAFTVNVWLDGPWDNDTWKGTKIGEINVPANSAQEAAQFTVDVSEFVDPLEKKHALFLTAEGGQGTLFDLIGLGFSSDTKPIVRPIAPAVSISVNGEAIELPVTPVRSTYVNGIVGYDLYETTVTLPASAAGVPVVAASAENPDVKVQITQAESRTGTAVVQFDYKGVAKTYRVLFNFAAPIGSSDRGDGTYTNPFIVADVPDLSIIRVGDTYWMSSTTMHMSPGVPIMKSDDLVNWETVSYCYFVMEDTDNNKLLGNHHMYSHGTWASSLRHKDGTFYLVVPSPTSNKTYFFHNDDPEKKPWTRYEHNTRYHDCGLLLDDDGRNWLVWGVGALNIIELNKEVTDVMPGAQRRIILPSMHAPDPLTGETPRGGLAEGAHIEKIDGTYYIFAITWPSGKPRSVVCHRAQSLNGPWESKVVAMEGIRHDGSSTGTRGGDGPAQGSIVDDGKGNWWGFVFRDSGPVGRVPWLVPITWTDGFPMFGQNEDGTGSYTNLSRGGNKPIPGKEIKSIVTSDEFDNGTVRPAYLHSPLPARVSFREGEYDDNGSNLHLAWQWNHNPDNRYWSLTDRPGWLRLKAILNSAVEERHLLNARNTLTQRVVGPYSSAVTALDVSHMKDGDEAGLTLFAAKYGSIGVKMEDGNKFLVTTLSNGWRTGHATNAGKEDARIPLTGNKIYLKAEGDFSVADLGAVNPGNFFYSYDGEKWEKLGGTLHMTYSTANHFMGYRFGLYNFAKTSEGGYVDFDYFRFGDRTP